MGDHLNAGQGTDNEGPLYGNNHLGDRLSTLDHRLFGRSMNPGPQPAAYEPSRHQKTVLLSSLLGEARRDPVTQPGAQFVSGLGEQMPG
ncbi:MAG TPA: hypothetical protein VKA77_18435, partial [Mycobacterium sp.]|nr:hypothetical protein [Mycobacterium sp.]